MDLILIPDEMCPDSEIEAGILGKKFKVHRAGVKNFSDIPSDLLSKAKGILLWHQIQLNKNALSQLPHCKVVVRVGAGLDNIDLQAAKDLNIHVSSVPDYGIEDVADHSIALLMSIGRGLDRFQSQVHEKDWSWDRAWPRKRIAGQNLGLIGLGRIGMAVALRAKALFHEVGFFDPYKERGIEKSLRIKRYESLDELLQNSDAISFHCPLNSSTTHLADSAFFKKCRDRLLLVNTARGGIIDLDALYEGMRAGKVQMAGLDVHENEPNYSHPLIAAYLKREAWIKDRLILTPHAAFLNTEAMTELRSKAAEEALRILSGEGARYPCHP